MKSNKLTSFIIVAGIVVLVVFTSVAAYNFLPQNLSSDSYYVKVEEGMSAKIEALSIDNGKLKITTSGDTSHYCIKSTKSKPRENALCWKNIENNTATIFVMRNEKYYVWIRDNEGNISIPISINTNDA